MSEGIDTENEDFQLPKLSVAADHPTQQLEAKMGGIVWALTELEIALDGVAASKVHDLKYRLADELNAIIREAGNYNFIGQSQMKAS